MVSSYTEDMMQAAALGDELTALGDAIRKKTGKTEKMSIEEMAKTIREMGGSDEPGILQWLNDESEIVVPDGIKELPDGKFQNMKLQKITLPESLTSIGNECFRSASNLKSIRIPKNVTRIGDSCFQHCSSLMSVILEPTTPPDIGSGNPFNSTNGLLDIGVPSAALSTYKNDSKWSKLSSKIRGRNDI